MLLSCNQAHFLPPPPLLNLGQPLMFSLSIISILCTFIYKFLCECKFSSLCGECTGVLITLWYGGCVFSFLKHGQTFPEWLVPFYIPTSNGWVIQFLYILRHSDKCVAVSHWFSFNLCFLMARDIEHFSCAYLLSIYPFWWNVSSCLLPIFWLNWFFLLLNFESFLRVRY